MITFTAAILTDFNYKNQQYSQEYHQHSPHIHTKDRGASVLCLPIKDGDTILGVIEVTDKVPSKGNYETFTEEDREMLQAFCLGSQHT